MEFLPIGVVRSPYKTVDEAPYQGREVEALSEIKIYGKFSEALEGIERHSYLIVLYWAHQVDRNKTMRELTQKERGVFSTRSGKRPNPICLCLVELIKRKNNSLIVKWLDAVDGSPVLDIKPYFKELDAP